MQEQLFQRLRELGIDNFTVPYPAHRTVEEGRALRGRMRGTFTKNLLLRDRKKRLYLVVIEERRDIDLKTFAARIGAKGHLSFAPAEAMRETLGVDPGTATPLGLINDLEHRVTPVIDASLLQSEWVNFHPLVQTASTSIHPEGLLAFMSACGHEPLIVEM